MDEVGFGIVYEVYGVEIGWDVIGRCCFGIVEIIIEIVLGG